MAGSRTVMRNSRWGILIATLVTTSALSLTSWSNDSRTRDTSMTLVRGQGDLLLDSASQFIRGLDRRPTEADLAALLDRLGPRGVRYIGFRLPRDEYIAVGHPRGDLEPARGRVQPRGKPVVVSQLGPVVRIDVLRRGLPLPRHGRPDGPRHRRPPPPMAIPPLSFEFEPVVANELVAVARRSFIISLITSGIMLVAALVAFALLYRRERKEAELAHERHLASLGQMSAVLAHEIRNPLAALKGHAQLLAEALPDGGKSKQKADRVVSEAIRLEKLTADLLAFVRTGEIKRRATDPFAVLRGAAAEIGSDRIDAVAEQAPRSWTMDGDRMHQVLSNVLQNALQAAPDGRVEARVTGDKGVLVYQISDSGPGIEAGQEQAIFEPFRTTRVHGTGLGLAVARRVVELHGGTIRAHNRPEGGAVFSIRLPRGT